MRAHYGEAISNREFEWIDLLDVFAMVGFIVLNVMRGKIRDDMSQTIFENPPARRDDVLTVFQAASAPAFIAQFVVEKQLPRVVRLEHLQPTLQSFCDKHPDISQLAELNALLTERMENDNYMTVEEYREIVIQSNER